MVSKGQVSLETLFRATLYFAIAFALGTSVFASRSIESGWEVLLLFATALLAGTFFGAGSGKLLGSTFKGAVAGWWAVLALIAFTAQR